MSEYSKIVIFALVTLVFLNPFGSFAYSSECSEIEERCVEEVEKCNETLVDCEGTSEQCARAREVCVDVANECNEIMERCKDGEDPFPTPSPTPVSPELDCKDEVCKTALGDIDVSDTARVVETVFSWILSIAGLIALGLFVYSGYKLMFSRGDQEAVAGAKETITSAVVGLLFIIFSLVILRIIGYEVLRIPNFG